MSARQSRIGEISGRAFLSEDSFRDATSVTQSRLKRCWTAKFLSRARRTTMGRGILLWLLGVPIPIILLLALFTR
jgi:hypothetical protein